MAILIRWCVVGMLSLMLGYTGTALAFEDDEACLMCHKYPKMGRITETGIQKSYYVMPHVFSKTVHRNVPCRDCHGYIKELPHKPVTEGVTCNQECHSIKNPATGKPFSHKPIYDVFKKSVHGREKIATGLEDDKPYCITCHTNPLYNALEETPPKHIVDRCVVCHEDVKFAEKWYSHTSRRIREIKRSPQEIVAMCSSCHADQQMLDRHQQAAKEEGRELGKKFPIAAVSYDESFHGKVTKYGNMQAANCLDCHANTANYYMSVHELLPSRDPKSPVSSENRVETCKRCHTRADKNYAQLDPHPSSLKKQNAFKHYAELIYAIIGDSVLLMLVGLAAFETWGRIRNGVSWRFRNGSSWWRRTRRRSNRIF